MSKPIKLVLLYGGKSGEHEVSLRSAASVLAHLDPLRYDVTPVGLDKQGQWFLNDAQELLTYTDALPVVTPRSKPLSSILQNGQLALDADIVFPVMHGPLYEDGCLQGLLMLANVAYVGCDVLSSAVGMDKDIARRLACIQGIHSVRYRSLSGRVNDAQLDAFCHDVALELGWPLFVKPCSMGSSVGIHKVHNYTELREAIVDARRYDAWVLVEEFIQGREIELAVLESASGELRVSVPGEVRVHHPDGFYSYSAKYLQSEQTELIIPASLEQNMVTSLQQAAMAIFNHLKCKGLARVDFFVQDETGKIYFNEINTLPGFTSISMYPKMCEASGIAYTTLLTTLIDGALYHQRERQKWITHYQ